LIDELACLPVRDPRGHKGTFGTVLVIGGHAGAPRVMIGGPAFTANAALRTGAGLAVLAMPEPVLPHGMQLAPSATGVPLPVDEGLIVQPSLAAERLDAARANVRCLAIGPGLGQGTAVQQLVVWLLSREDTPAVVDADAINALAQLTDGSADVRAPAVFTPHPGEYTRLAQTLGIDIDPTDETKREEAARRLAGRLGAVVVLKGHRTVISDGVRAHVNETGGAVLATAGTGDVLTGIIAGLITQFARPAPDGRSLSLYDCARIGVWLHGAAGDRWAERHGDAGVLATDLIDAIPTTMAAMRAGGA